jgi:opacity protein-like surface antigen
MGVPKMKKYLVAISASAFLFAAGAAQAQSFDDMFSDSYVSVLGGWASHPGLSIGGNSHASVNDGYNVGARVGTWIAAGPNVTFDVDYFYNRGDYAGSAAHLNSSSVMGDLLYHIPTSMPLSFYGGGGLGMVNTDLSGTLHGSSIVLGWQALGGAEWALSPQTSLFAEYRYQNAHDANIAAIKNVGNTSNNVSVGVKFNL